MPEKPDTKTTIKQEYFRPEQEAKRLGVPKQWIWTKVREGVIPASRVGKYLFLRPEDTDKALANHRL
jgi:excisionase family DNA binding protein